VRTRQQKRLEAEERQARSRERKACQEVVHRLEQEIRELEIRQVELTAELEKPETYRQAGRALEINRDLSCVMQELTALNGKWEAAATELASFERPSP
jgi:ATP-binding cassette subfamily F protein 3